MKGDTTEASFDIHLVVDNTATLKEYEDQLRLLISKRENLTIKLDSIEGMYRKLKGEYQNVYSEALRLEVKIRNLKRE